MSVWGVLPKDPVITEPPRGRDMKVEALFKKVISEMLPFLRTSRSIPIPKTILFFLKYVGKIKIFQYNA